MLTEQERHLSWSQVSTWLSCGERYRLRYVERVPEVASGAAIGGQAVHATIAEAEAQGWWREEAPWQDGGEAVQHLHAGLAERIEAAGEVRWGGRRTREYPQGEDRIWWERVGPMMLRRYAQYRRTMAAEGWDVLEPEMRLTLDLGQVPLIGYVDAMLAHQDGEPGLIDWKTGQPGRGNPLQLAVYALLIERTRGTALDNGLFVYLRTADERRAVERVDLRPLLPHVERTLREAWRGISAGVYVANPGPFCAGCPVRRSCWYGATLNEEDEA